MSQQLIVITGANRGMGLETALALAARRDTRIVMACRDLDAALRVRGELIRRSGNPGIDALRLDLADTRSIRAFAQAFADRYGRIDRLVNNAAVIAKGSTLTADGFTQNIGINYLGPYLLTKLLVPLFPEGGGRIVNVSSLLYSRGRFDRESFSFEKAFAYRGLKGYSVSKYMILVWSLRMARELRARGIDVNVADPGVARTAIFHPTGGFARFMDVAARFVFKSAAQAARTAIWLASDESLAGTSGGFYKACKPRRIADQDGDPSLADLLVKKTEELLSPVLAAR